MQNSILDEAQPGIKIARRNISNLKYVNDVSAFHIPSRFGRAFLPSSKCLLILSAVILQLKKIKSVTVATFSPFICHKMMGPDDMIFIF